MDSRPTCELVLEAAKGFTERGQTPFRRRDLVEAVQSVDPSRGYGSISPVIQGMTINAPDGGPPSPCGKVLYRVERGWYVLLPTGRDLDGTTSPVPSPVPRSTPKTSKPVGFKRLKPGVLRDRMEGLVAEFDACAEEYDRTVPFTRVGQYELHRETIDRRLALGSVRDAVYDHNFTGILHATLRAWGIGRRRSSLAPLDAFRKSLQDHVSQLETLEGLSLESQDLNVRVTTRRVYGLITELEVVDNVARIVAGTKTLHHLLPDLVPPMDRAWTGMFFGWTATDPQNRQEAIFTEAFTSLAEVARQTSPARLVGLGWRTCQTKVIDNALIGYCKLHIA